MYHVYVTYLVQANDTCVISQVENTAVVPGVVLMEVFETDGANRPRLQNKLFQLGRACSYFRPMAACTTAVPSVALGKTWSPQESEQHTNGTHHIRYKYKYYLVTWWFKFVKKKHNISDFWN